MPDLEHGLRCFVLLALRLAPVVSSSPVFGLRSAPAGVRGGVLFMLTASLLPLAIASAPDSDVPFFLAGLRELALGVFFAVLAAVPLTALELGGRLVDLGRGANLAEVLAPPTGDRTSPLGDVALLGGLAIFSAAGGLRALVGVFAHGLGTLPLGTIARTPSAMAENVAMAAAGGLTYGVGIAMPALLSVMLVDVAFGLVGRSAPSFSTFFAAMPVRAVVGLLAFALTVGLALDASHEHSATVLRALARLMTPGI